MLGVRWCVETDHFVLDVSEVGHQARSLSPTKRNIVSLVGRIYDPLGFLSPVVIRLKSLFQELCELKLGWDEPLKGAPLSKWESMVTGLQADQQIRVPRYLLCDVHHPVDSCSLIGFCDASKKAYAGVVYLRVKTQQSSPCNHRPFQDWNCCQVCLISSEKEHNNLSAVSAWCCLEAWTE